MSTPIADGHVVQIHYTLTVDDKVVDRSRGGKPMAYLHGADNIVKGLEAALTGKQPGDNVKVVIEPADGYGVRDETVQPQSVKKSQLPKNVPPRVGVGFKASGSGDKEVVLYITAVKGSRVVLDTNHPMAGKTLHFDVDVVAVRKADPSEVEHGHVHDGHHHH